jgi:hypothetical protein
MQPADWRNDWTEAKAKEYCMDYLFNRPSVKACDGVPNIETEQNVNT